MSSTADEIRGLVDRFNGLVQDLQDGINSALDSVPFFLDWLVDKIKDLWNDLMAKIKQFFEPLMYILSNLGQPPTVSSVADRWNSTVGQPVDARADLATTGTVRVDDTWKGSAAEQYKQQLPLQQKALANIRAQFTEGISTALKDVSSAIQTFFGRMVVAIGAWIAAIIVALGATGTIVGIPAGIVIAIGAAAGFGAAFYASGEDLKSSCRAAKTVMEQKLAVSAGYPGGAWPVATL